MQGQGLHPSPAHKVNHKGVRSQGTMSGVTDLVKETPENELLPQLGGETRQQIFQGLGLRFQAPRVRRNQFCCFREVSSAVLSRAEQKVAKNVSFSVLITTAI